MSTPAIAVQRPSILAVDDTPANLELLVECLSPLYDVRVATGGERALKLCAQRLPDLVLLDVMMPGMDGFEVLRRLKADPATAGVPVIFATAKDDKADEQAGLELGAADYVSKPIHIPVLLARVATHLALQSHRRDLEELVRQRTDELGRALRQVEQDERSLQASHARLEFLHSHDTLTSLPNQQFLAKRLGEEMRRSLMESSQLAVVTFNVDRLRNLNQSLGVAAGDEVLVHVAACLQAAVESPDLPARLTGDEFALLVTTQPGETELENRARTVAEAVLDAATRRPAAQGAAAEVTLSAGIAVFPDDGVSPTELLRNSQRATAAAKRAGRNRVLRYETGLAGIDTAERFELQSALRQAIHERRLRPHYQPKVDARTGALVGAEALVRWPLEGGDFRSPGEFIPLAEEYGLIEALDDQVMYAVLRQLAEWKPRLPPGFRIAVNVTSNRFHDESYASTVATMVRETGADPRHLELEITEGALIGDMAACLRNLKTLSALDIHFALDDFGTGYSSLSYLKQLPLQKLKVDQSFIRDIDRDAHDAAIVQAVLALAGALHLETIAEGVETPAQLEFVQRLGCSIIQGFLFSPAVDAEKFAKLIDAGRLEMAPPRPRR